MGREHLVSAVLVAVDPVLPAARGHLQPVDQYDGVGRADARFAL
jgi:hypothetical protein